MLVGPAIYNSAEMSAGLKVWVRDYYLSSKRYGIRSRGRAGIAPGQVRARECCVVLNS